MAGNLNLPNINVPPMSEAARNVAAERAQQAQMDAAQKAAADETRRQSIIENRQLQPDTTLAQAERREASAQRTERREARSERRDDRERMRTGESPEDFAKRKETEKAQQASYDEMYRAAFGNETKLTKTLRGIGEIATNFGRGLKGQDYMTPVEEQRRQQLAGKQLNVSQNVETHMGTAGETGKDARIGAQEHQVGMQGRDQDFARWTTEGNWEQARNNMREGFQHATSEAERGRQFTANQNQLDRNFSEAMAAGNHERAKEIMDLQFENAFAMANLSHEQTQEIMELNKKLNVDQQMDLWRGMAAMGSGNEQDGIALFNRALSGVTNAEHIQRMIDLGAVTAARISREVRAWVPGVGMQGTNVSEGMMQGGYNNQQGGGGTSDARAKTNVSHYFNKGKKK